MISQFTKTGTKVICINASVTCRFTTRAVRSVDPNLDGLEQWSVYTVSAIVEDRFVVGGFGVILAEINRPTKSEADTGAYALQRFSPAALPKALMDTLTAPPSEEMGDLMREAREFEEV